MRQNDFGQIFISSPIDNSNLITFAHTQNSDTMLAFRLRELMHTFNIGSIKYLHKTSLKD